MPLIIGILLIAAVTYVPLALIVILAGIFFYYYSHPNNSN